jgi:hypothetical protein
MNATAAADVAREMKRRIEDQGVYAAEFVWRYRDSAREAVVSSARHPSFSTSPTSNLMDQFKLSSIAKWVEILDQAVMHLEGNGITRGTPSTTDEA